MKESLLKYRKERPKIQQQFADLKVGAPSPPSILLLLCYVMIIEAVSCDGAGY